jgi:hypothetical protein
VSTYVTRLDPWQVNVPYISLVEDRQDMIACLSLNNYSNKRAHMDANVWLVLSTYYKSHTESLPSKVLLAAAAGVVALG